MSKKTDKVIIVDLEATCWPKKERDQHVSEIIEIGLCVVDCHSLTVGVKESILIHPMQSTISNFCIDLTSITQDMVDEDGIDLNKASTYIRAKYNSLDYTWGSWGDYDRNIMDRTCKERRIRYPFGKTHLNIKNFFALCNGFNKETSMANALNFKNMPLVGLHHRAADDAKNVAKLLLTILEG